MAIMPAARTATERIEHKIQTLDFIKSHMIELSKMAARDKLDMLCYLMEMAIVEAETVIVDQKAVAGISKNVKRSPMVSR